MRRILVLLAAMALTLAVASGVALAVNEIGTNGPDTLRGPTGTTSRAVALTTYCGAVAATTSLAGPAATNRFFSRGDKNLVGGSGNDTVIGGLHKGGPSMSS